MISEICCIFIVPNYKELQTTIAIITENKVIELFCMADDFCKFFDAMTAKYTLKSTTKRTYHRASTMSKAEIKLIMILFHDSGYRCLKHSAKFHFLFKQTCSYYTKILRIFVLLKHITHDTRTRRRFLSV